jgi:hypothetical protein
MLGAEPEILGALGAVRQIDAQLDDVLAQHLAAIDAAGRRRVPVVRVAQPEPPLATPSLYAHGGGRRRVAAAVGACPMVPNHADAGYAGGGGKTGRYLAISG